MPLVSALAFGGEPDFRVPGPDERLRAIGDTSGLPDPLRRALDPASGFEPIPKPGPMDWLAEHPEGGQTFEEFRRARKNLPTPERSTLYLQPLGAFGGAGAPSLATLREFAEAFFAMPVKILDPVALEPEKFTTRVNAFTGKRQLLTTDLLRFLEKRLPKDAFSLLGITMEDLYPDPTWNFVFGQASIRDRTGVYSFARYDPAFYGSPREKGFEKLVLERSCRVLAHETGHMFGLLHCVYFRCLMNGSNHLGEADARPLHLCPVCLRKLQSSIRFDAVARYRNLRDFFAKVGEEEEAAWTEARLRDIEGGAASGARPPP
ncbi:MAG: archaemetzincin [Planctomycetota bacterium]